ncbi:MAG: glycosyltransferase family 4 protein [Acidobacteriota bacterium]
MNILALTYELPPVGGGGGRATNDVLQRLVDEGHSVDIITMHVSGLPKVSARVDKPTVYRVFSGRLNRSHCGIIPACIYVLTAWWKARTLLTSKQYSVIHATFIFPSGIVAALLSTRYEVPYVVTAHGSDVPGHNRSLSTLFRLLKKPWRSIVTSAWAVTTVSTYLADLIKQQASRDIVVIPNGLRTRDFPETNYGRTVLVVGRLQGFKSVDRGMTAFIQSKARQRGYRLAIVGHGPQRMRLQKLAQTHHIPVVFHGWVSRSKLIDLYQQSSILISASQFESFGGVVMEAMACGLAVIATDVGGCRELIGEAGILTPSDSTQHITDALNYYLDDETHLKEMGRKARRRIAQHYDIRTIASSYEHVLLAASKYL